MLVHLEDIAQAEAPMKMFGKILTVVLAPSTQKKKTKSPGDTQ